MKRKLAEYFLMVLIALVLSRPTRAHASVECADWGCTFLVPGVANDGPGNAISYLPFVWHPSIEDGGYYGPIRYQQVFSATEFSKALPRGGFVTSFAFRPACNTRELTTSTNFQVNLSTTKARPDGLNAKFAENLGLDDTIVFGPGQASGGAWADGCPPRRTSGIVPIVLQVPFFYDPAKGNLLMDLRNAGCIPKVTFFDPLDAQDVPNDGVSRIYGFSLEAPEAEFVDTVGVVTFFTISYPELHITYQSTNVVLKWPDRPDQLNLQWTDSLMGVPVWHPYVGPIEEVFELLKAATIPKDQLGTQKYFRLFLDSPQPQLPTPAIKGSATLKADQLNR